MTICQICGTEYGIDPDYLCLTCKSEIRKGWICPRCGKVHAPDIKTCDCKNLGREELVWKNGKYLRPA
jgi:hypothetical protein